MEYLNELDKLVYNRYLTVERNIKARSNSFYDSFLDLIEATIKTILDNNNLEYDTTRTNGYIIKQANIKSFLCTFLDNNTYDNICDYTKKINDHKHKKEKHVTIDSVLNYMSFYYELIRSYYNYKGFESVGVYDADYYNEIFGATEKENRRLKNEVSMLENELNEASVKAKLSEIDKARLEQVVSKQVDDLKDLDFQNQVLQEQISALKDIKISSMEQKLNKTIDMLNNMQDYLIENRILSRKTRKLIDGKVISDEELKAERLKMEMK